ncbi:outer membrane scaffolding protein for murein synthesis (MipA/OmpV family) [Marinobacter pelagius]|uniref:Outer membrane scaffolding protein for murein synthesis (MipA/OmpV family) n=1 Tax=Marinobacter pelagius TaxID=379482 RepID=A0A366GZ89_9GAMM|nr:MipA/OmpV family protein [Marinobacter pelagius]RBP33951.1 outer membrane scaffolding protein for murein synthesis (MipA/OmpV family) [Marinobacter pelagius]
MKKFIGLTLAIFVQVFFVQTAIGEESRTALVPLPSVDDFTRGEDGWGVGLGLGIEYESAYEGSDEYELEVDPAGAVQWRNGNDIYYWAGAALGWRGLRSQAWLFDVSVAFPFEEGREESDSEDGRLDGLGDIDGSTEIVLQARRALDSDWRYWLDGRLIASEDGSLGIFGAGRRFGDQTDGTGSDLSLVLVFHDSDYANRDFGINAEQAVNSGLAETDLDGGFRSIGLNYTFRYFVSDNWQLYGEALYEHFSSDVRDSPIARSDFEAEVGVGAIYVF